MNIWSITSTHNPEERSTYHEVAVTIVMGITATELKSDIPHAHS